MAARLILRRRLVLSEAAFVEVVIWRVPESVRGSRHSFKYRLALVESGDCVLRYDNEAGKGDHRHVDGHEIDYDFVDLDTLQRDFWSDLAAWRFR